MTALSHLYWEKGFLNWFNGAGIFFGRGVPNLQKVGVDKTETPISTTKIL